MENITTYYATRKNVFVWLAALLSIVSAVARIAFALESNCIGGAGVFVHTILPVAANLIIAIRLPWRGEKQFYVTVVPILILTTFICVFGLNTGAPFYMSAIFIFMGIAFALLYFLTFSGKIKTKLWVLGLIVIEAIGLGILGWNKNLKGIMEGRPGGRWYLFANGAAALSFLAVILSARKMPPYQEGEEYRLRFGDRLDGRRIRNMPIMSKVTPFFMTTRLNRSNYIDDTVEISHMEQYIRQKRNQGLKHFGITHVILASYIRTLAEMPELNRFVAGQKIYHRYEISVNMVVKKEMKKDAPDSSIKVIFNPEDTADQVYSKFDAALEKAKEEGISNGFDSITHVLDYLPSVIMSFFGFVVRFLDYFSIMPMALERVSPFHGSLFITSMGSLGIPPIYHHLYDFGTVPVFCAFGHKYTRYELNKNGDKVTKKYIDYKIVCDEGICDGFYYAAAMKKLRSYMTHPERLDLPPEEVVQDIY